MKKQFKEYNPNQLLLLPPSLQDWLPRDHLAYFISEVVEQFDLSAIYGAYESSRGQPPYSVLMMVKVWLYAFSQGIRSSRRVEKALYEDVAFRVLSANQQPDYWTLNDFRRRHHKAIGDLLVQTIHLAQRAGLVKLGHVALDGSKIKANASKHSAMSYGYMEKEEERLRAEIERYFREADAIDEEEDRRYGNRRGDELPEHLSTPEKRLFAIREAKRALEEEARKKAEAEQAAKRKKVESEGRVFEPRKDPEEARPDPKSQRNFTDPESRIMKNSDKAFVQAYNAQAAVDADSQIIVAAEVTNQASDAPHLLPMIDQVEVNTGGEVPQEVSADAGYWNEVNVRTLLDQGLEVLIPPDKVTHSEWRDAKPVVGRIPDEITLKDRMRRKLRTKKGKQKYKLRMTSVEPVFGQIKECRGLRQFLVRGLEKVRSFWRIDCAVHNLLKLFRAKICLQPGG